MSESEQDGADEAYRHKWESEEWDRGDRQSDHYQEWLEASAGNPLSQHGDGPLNKVLDPEDMPWEESPHGQLKHVVNASLAEEFDYPCKGVNLYIQKIEPGGKSGKHRHMSEELVFVLEGEGYDLHWDPTANIEEVYEWEWPDEPQRFDWEQEDVVFIPTNTAHQHHNKSDSKPVRLLCCQARAYDDLGYGLNDLEQFENAPEFDGE